MNRPKPLVPEDLAKRAARPSVYLCRAATASLRSFVSDGATPINIARDLWGDDSVTNLVLRAATAPARTDTANWAQQLATTSIIDFVQSITSISAAAEVISRALKINLDGIAQALIPARVLNASDAGGWIGEGAPIPVRSLNFSNAATLVPRKLAVISPYTREMAESSNIEAIVKQTLGESSAALLDQSLFSATAGDATRPPGLFNGVTPITPTPVSGSTTPGEAAGTDLGNLFAALAAKGGGKTAVIIAAMPQAVRLKLIAGPKFDHDIIASTALAPGTVALLEVASFVSGFGSVAEFRTTKVAALAMDTAPVDISAAPAVKSLFQVDGIAQIMQLWAAWGLRAVGHVQWVQNTTW
jgi:Phage capsid family